MNRPERIVQSSTMCYELWTWGIQYADCKLVSIQHGSARLHRRDTEVPIPPCWPDRLRTNLPLQKTCSLLRRATQAARFRGSRVHRNLGSGSCAGLKKYSATDWQYATYCIVVSCSSLYTLAKLKAVRWVSYFQKTGDYIKAERCSVYRESEIVAVHV